jgi:hypothetical protein
MSTPDTLPMEITLITLLLFKLQVYSTSLHHYHHRPITLSTFWLLHKSTIHHMASINTLQLPIKKFFCPQDWHSTHTVQPHTASATRSSIAITSLDFYQFSWAYFHFNCTHQESWDPLMAILQPSSIFKFNYGTTLREIVATFITGSTLDSINQTSMATTATHAIRHCNTFSTQNACDWCDLAIFLV